MRMKPSRLSRKQVYFRDLLAAGTAATLVSGIPSTVYAWLSGGDPLEASRAAGAMLIPAGSPLTQLLVAAAIVHVAVSFFWAAILVAVLPRTHILVSATAAAALIGFIDLRLIAPPLFPEVAALAFVPQMADHLMWGASLGWVLARRSRIEKAVASCG